MFARILHFGSLKALFSDRSESLNFLVLNLGVLTRELLLLLGKVVERAAVRLSMAVLGAKDVSALARVLHETDFLAALPALINVCLQSELVNES